jgi:hypothetical protein
MVLALTVKKGGMETLTPLIAGEETWNNRENDMVPKEDHGHQAMSATISTGKTITRAGGVTSVPETATRGGGVAAVLETGMIEGGEGAAPETALRAGAAAAAREAATRKGGTTAVPETADVCVVRMNSTQMIAMQGMTTTPHANGNANSADRGEKKVGISQQGQP